MSVFAIPSRSLQSSLSHSSLRVSAKDRLARRVRMLAHELRKAHPEGSQRLSSRDRRRARSEIPTRSHATGVEGFNSFAFVHLVNFDIAMITNQDHGSTTSQPRMHAFPPPYPTAPPPGNFPTSLYIIMYSFSPRSKEHLVKFEIDLFGQLGPLISQKCTQVDMAPVLTMTRTIDEKMWLWIAHEC